MRAAGAVVKALLAGEWWQDRPLKGTPTGKAMAEGGEPLARLCSAARCPLAAEVAAAAKPPLFGLEACPSSATGHAPPSWWYTHPGVCTA